MGALPGNLTEVSVELLIDVSATFEQADGNTPVKAVESGHETTEFRGQGRIHAQSGRQGLVDDFRRKVVHAGGPCESPGVLE